MGEIVKIISTLGVDASRVYSEMDKVNEKYGESTKELRKTEEELARLIKKEKDLLIERKNASNPTVVTRYNKELEKTRTSIENNQKAVKQLTAETAKYEKELDKISKTAKKAFEATKTTSTGNNFLSILGGVGVANSITGVISSLKQAGVESLELSAKAEGVRTAFARIGGEKTLEKLRVATRGAVSDLDLMQQTLRAKNFGIAPELLAKGLELAGKVARTTGQDVNYLADSFVNGVGRKSLLILDNLQISQVKLREEIKKTGDFNIAVTNILNQKLAETGVVVETTADKLAKFTSFFKDLKTQAGDFVINEGNSLINFFKALSGQMSFKSAINADALDKQADLYRAFNGDILDEAKKSELRRLQLLEESSTRITQNLKDLTTSATAEDIKLLNQRIANSSGFERVELIKERDRLERLKKRTTEQVIQLRFQLQNERQLNDDLRNLNKARTVDFDEEAAKRLKKEKDFIEQLEIDIRKAQSVLRSQVAQNSDISELDKIEARFLELSIQKNIEFEKRRDAIKEEIQDEKIKQEALINLKHLENIELNQLDNQRITDIKIANLRKVAAELEGAKSIADLDLKLQQSITTFSLDQTDEKIAIIVDYTSKKMDLMRKEGKDEIEILKMVKDAALSVEELRKQQFIALKKQENAEFAELERFHLASLEYRKKIYQSQITKSEIAFAEERLARMREDYQKQVEITGVQDQEQLLLITKQENDISLLKKKFRKQERQEIIDQTIFVIDNINKITQAVVDAANQVINAEIAKTDKLLSLQQQRVDNAAKIAENGNAQLLELEKDRLEKLNKEKEKFVRQQQVLATIELVANTAVTVSKAAAEGGAGAAFTIAAALIALIGGLASARSIAGTAAFYEGGYTGDGNPREESRAIGKRDYVYHKAEFVHNHITTKKYRRIFQDVHEGKLDLNQMKFESDMYKHLKASGIDTSREVTYRNAPSSNQDIMQLKSSMESIKDAIQGQSRLKVTIDKNGISLIASEYNKNRKRINNIAS